LGLQGHLCPVIKSDLLSFRSVLADNHAKLSIMLWLADQTVHLDAVTCDKKRICSCHFFYPRKPRLLFLGQSDTT